MATSFFCPDAETILRQDAIEWKRRALAAEGKLSGYKRLRVIGEEVLRVICERDHDAKARAIDELSEELEMLDVVDAPRDPFLQKIDLGEGNMIEIRQKAGLGSCSMLDGERGIIELEALQPDEGKTIGLFFQLLQLADISVSVRDGTPLRMDETYLHAITIPVLLLALELGLLTPSIRITGASLEAYITTLSKLEAAGAASNELG